ncbi:uncharacterized protein BT62DRAFT_930176 [Guyanagaster necrorhizus]|uniref:Uncharacterized protein n=1 Tax=Guyanagaster necrorhizus TaxID=856835 RepID=A0A9P7VX69_9AGAR|nr:uncharacterized protein BT62DRAFT_930176 [Guyanagaster necrorhizus MCA 3950]KAG7448095.1 hypothetical protein BT62DRAFT_930176 [Guyanagaster necrorhizus MCA 3950]
MTSVQSRIHAFESLSKTSSSPSPPSASLIDLKDWVVDVTPIVDVAPPLPPRNNSKSLKLPVMHTYPPKHTSASSISSFHSVSLDGQTSTDGDSIDDSSYENVSPVRLTPPKLPKRPPSASSTLTTSTTSSTRRPPPPPPASSSRSSITSTRPSSRASSTSLGPSLTRPTPIPPTARARYISVFDLNISQRKLARQQRKAKPPPTLPFLSPRKSRQAAGWRGLSVDLITGVDDLPAAESDSEDDSPFTLPPHIVKRIWRKSCLEDIKLAQIWCAS